MRNKVCNIINAYSFDIHCISISHETDLSELDVVQANVAPILSSCAYMPIS